MIAVTWKIYFAVLWRRFLDRLKRWLNNRNLLTTIKWKYQNWKDERKDKKYLKSVLTQK